jgi:anti-anti-sigma regulatory factor
MKMYLTQHPGNVPVSVLKLEGSLDGSNYETLIAEARKLYDSGVRNLLLDLGPLTFLSSAGISALHRVALLFQGKKSAELEEGWAAFRAMDRDRDSGVHQHVKLLSPTDKVKGTLDTVGFSSFFEIYTDLEAAVASFKA